MLITDSFRIFAKKIIRYGLSQVQKQSSCKGWHSSLKAALQM